AEAALQHGQPIFPGPAEGHSLGDIPADRLDLTGLGQALHGLSVLDRQRHSDLLGRPLPWRHTAKTIGMASRCPVARPGCESVRFRLPLWHQRRPSRLKIESPHYPLSGGHPPRVGDRAGSVERRSVATDSPTRGRTWMTGRLEVKEISKRYGDVIALQEM